MAPKRTRVAEGQMKVFLNPLTDFGFKKVFLDKVLLIAFLNDVTGWNNIIDIRYLPAEQLGDTAKNRKAVFDLYCITADDEHFIVEMQKGQQHYFADRALFYASYPIRSQAPRGKDWDYRLDPVCFVSVLNFVLFDDRESENSVIEKVYLMRERTKTRFSDKLNFFFIELPKFNKPLDELETNTDRWLYSLKHLPDLDKRPPEMQGAIFERLFELAKIEKLTPNEMKTYKKSLLEYSGVRAIADYARDEGEARGKEIGEARKTVQVVMNAHAADYPLESIAHITGLTLEEVKKIIASQLS
ncbi:MAG: Rpn family recombination-promoting nuclease/putative transposase [Tannerellaceae bacterium]|nr:Rpn family recombination-promoting nuclease/putative transposase [Tannerellaceae bacterium]